MAEVVQQLSAWMGIRRVISLVDRHEWNGVEGTNKQILRHLRTLVHDLRALKKWSDPTILSLVLFANNDGVNLETGVRPLDAMFGSADRPYFRLPDSVDPTSITSAWVRRLDEDLRHSCSIASCIGYFGLYCALLYTILCCAYPSTLLYVSLDCSADGVYLHRQELSVINGQFCR